MLVLPGALFTVLAVAASVFGHRHAADGQRLSHAVEPFRKGA
ncbi:hypothetical protein [Streptomyces sp. 6-11-2]|nr:hypothetical protein [Streptomyces sp. 6-11-2]